MSDDAFETTISTELRHQLESAAREAAGHAHAPYSSFRVGAAVLGASGAIHCGANIENASYGLALCAERAALAAARVAGENVIAAIAVDCIDATPGSPASTRMPCGACRQWIQELAPDAQIFIAGERDSFAIDELLPHAFSLPD